MPRSSAGFRAPEAPEGRAWAPRGRFLPETPARVSCLLDHLIADRTFGYPNTSNDSEQARSAASAPSPPGDPGPPGPAPLPPARARLRGREGPCGALGGSAGPCGARRVPAPPVPERSRRCHQHHGERHGAGGTGGAGRGRGKARSKGEGKGRARRDLEGKGRGRGEGEGSRRGHRESTGRGEVPRDPQHWGLFLAKETMGVPAGARGCWLCAPTGRGCTRGLSPGHPQQLGLMC